MISIIIPTKDEEKIIYDTVIALQNLRENKLCEIILADGMSDDNTINIVRPYIDKVVTCPANRGSQQNLGARESSGQTLVFLHADTHINKKHIEFLSKLKSKQ
jgi:glycosyltransferase involved in cell wall biosynthesis